MSVTACLAKHVSRRSLRWALLVSLAIAPWTASAEEESAALYVRLTKGLVINYGEPSINRLRYLKLGLDLRVDSIEGQDAVEHHLPVLTDAVLMLFSGQDEEIIRGADGKEELRRMALRELRNIMKREEGEPYIDDLLFSGFVVQR